MSHRIAKVNTLIKQQLSRLFRETVDFKNTVLVTIVKVDTTPDLRYTQVFVSVLPQNEKEYVMKTLEHEHHALQKTLHKTLHMKILPKVTFVYDDTEARADVVEDLLRKTHEE